MRILGIDPGLATTGWAIVDFTKEGIEVVEFGVISTTKGREVPDRLSEIFDDINAILEKFEPERAGIETLLFTNNISTAMSVAEARGVVSLAIERAGVPMNHYSPTQIKSSIAGNGRADKKQVQENVMRICNLEEFPKPDDAADAIAVAITCNDTHKMQKLMDN